MKPPNNEPPATLLDSRDVRPAPASPPFPRADLVSFLGVIALAFALRVIWILQMRSCPLFEHPSLDALYHHDWAKAIAEGRTFIEGPYFRAPLYPWFLGAVYTIFGPGFLLPRLFQAAIGSLTCGVVFLIGRLAFDRKVGLLSGVAAAAFWVLCYFDGELLLE